MIKLTQTQQKQLRRLGKKHHLKMLLAYGSQVSGNADKGSDFDIAFLFDNKSKKNKYSFFYGELFNDLSEIFKGEEVDLANLHNADPLFKYEITSGSQLLCGNALDYEEFKAYAYKNYFDSADLFKLENIILNKQRRLLKQKLYAQ